MRHPFGMDHETPTPQRDPQTDDDAEGHVLGVNPTLADQLARARSGEIDRKVRHRSAEREARDRTRRGR